MITKELIKKLLDESIAADDHIKMSAYGAVWRQILYSEKYGEINVSEIVQWEIDMMYENIELKIEMGFPSAAIEMAKRVDVLIALTK